MSLHPHIGLPELIEYCQLANEYGDKCRKVKLDAHTLRRVRQVAKITGESTSFLGVSFYEK